MRFGIVVPVWIYQPQRLDYCRKSLASLSRTITSKLDGPIPIVFVLRDSQPLADTEAIVKEASFPQFTTRIIPQGEGNESCDGAVIYGYDYLLREFPEVTHLIFLTDDWLYSPHWLEAMRDLIERKPQAKAWWVYRSAYEYYHKTLRVEKDGDVLVRSTCPQGCMTGEEYLSMHLNWRDWTKLSPRACDIDFNQDTGTLRVLFQDMHWQELPQGAPREEALIPIRHGLSLDLMDPWFRWGERWVTARSYILNIGIQGINQTPETPELAIDFVGE
jgi:hypothetical protein